MSDIASAKGGTIESHYYADWKESTEGTLGKHRSKLPFGWEYPCKEDWKQ